MIRRLLGIVIVASATGCGVLLAAQGDPPATVPGADGSVTGDATTTADGEAGTEGDASACNARFCSDFDPPSVFPWGWTSTPTLPPPGMGLTGDASTSPPNALDITSGLGALAFLTLDIPGASLAARWTLDYRVLTVGSMSDLTLFELVCTDTASGIIADSVKVKVKADANKIKLQTTTGDSSDPIDFGGAGAFVSITVEIATPTARLTVGATPIEIGVNCPKTSTHAVHLGVVDTGDDAWRVQIDHVRGDWL